ncbi:hypothetical protein DFH27DRAFT_610013 [Peziza echinospora]|nr:hypothetical protein DFH27DRAFT_610013 [Peziza echinospora]
MMLPPSQHSQTTNILATTLLTLTCITILVLFYRHAISPILWGEGGGGVMLRDMGLGSDMHRGLGGRYRDEEEGGEGEEREEEGGGGEGEGGEGEAEGGMEDGGDGRIS